MLKITTFHGSWCTSTLKGVQIWEIWFKYNKICASLAVLQDVALPHLLQKCPHKIETNEKMSVQQSPPSDGHGTSEV